MTNANAEPNGTSKPDRPCQRHWKASAALDKADLSLSVEGQAKTAEAARNQAAGAMEALIKAVKNAGVADKDIQTRSVSLYPNYSPDTANVIVGY
ncbi:MAG: SIMPL domain-containing protein [Methylococcaceae bacterium]|nr:SIMPL domain-containing protein [Methylococcaceae bacterium]